jgi:chromosome partitioning protein
MDTTHTPTVRPRVVSLMNQKGGVGKTTTAVNLAHALARTGTRTLLIDLDPQAHSTLHLGADPASLESTVYDALLDPSSTPDSIIQSRENLWLLPSEVDLAASELELAEAPQRYARLQQALHTLPARPEIVLIDCPPSLGLLTLNALNASSEILIPMQAQFLALQGVSKLLETVTMLAGSSNPSLRVLGVTLCMHDRQTNLAKEVIADIEAFFEQSRSQAVPWNEAQVFRPAIRRHIKLAEAASFGQTIFEYAPDLAGARDYDALASTLVERWCDIDSPEEPEPEPTPTIEVKTHIAPSEPSSYA